MDSLKEEVMGMNDEALTQAIFEAGVIGAGGAGFPTHIKLVKDMHYLVINGAECEPLIYTDYEIMKHFSMELIIVIRDMLKALNIKKAVWGIKSKHKELINVLTLATALDKNINICPLENIYPAGDEITLIYKCTGIVIPKGELPSSKKVIELNVETLLNIYKCLYENTPVVDKYVTIAGAVKEPRVLKVPVGTPIQNLIDEVSVTISNYDILLGGPMMGNFVSPDIKVSKTTKAILLLPKNSVLSVKKKQIGLDSVKRAMSSCSQCRMCTDLCPRNKLGHKIEPHKLMNAFANGIVENSDKIYTALGCCGCNTCSYYACHHDLNPAELMMATKKELMKQGIRPEIEESVPLANPLSVEVPASRLLFKLGLKDYDRHAYLQKQPISTDIAFVPISAHIGKPANPIVKVGDKVTRKQKIAEASIGGISACVHSSIDGIVKVITEKEIIIKGGE